MKRSHTGPEPAIITQRLTGAGFFPSLVIIFIFFLWYTFFALPADLFPDSYSRVINDRDGNLLSAGISPDGQWRFPGTAQVPDKFRIALITCEDKRFNSHPGVDPLALARAIRLNITRGKIVSGGSTLTMQAIRLHRNGRPRTYSEKFMEALLAIRLTIRYTKGDVLRLFASHAPFGGNVVGLEAASWRYFGRPAEKLGWADAAMLAVLPNSPGLIHPGRNRGELMEKRNRLLSRLYEKGVIDRTDLRLAVDEPIPPEPLALPRHAPHLLDRLGLRRPEIFECEEGTVTTTINGTLQRQLNELAAVYLRQLSARGIDNIGIFVIETSSGEVSAYVGNGPVTSTPEGYVDMITAPRSTGSLLKPFLYGGMLDAGELMPRQLVLDIPTKMGTYMPENPTHVYLGAVRADQALAQSLNVPAARMLRDFGTGRFYNILEETGMTTLVRTADGYGVSLVLGGAEGTLENLTSMYAGLGRTVLNNSREDAFFAPVFLAEDTPEKTLDSPFHPGTSRLVLEALKGPARPEEEAGWRNLLSSKIVSWKTGTSYGFRDAWAIGVTPEYTIGVWAGNSTGEGKAENQGSKSAAPLLFRVLELLPAGGDFPWPTGMREIEVCTESGYPAGPDCPETEKILIPPVTSPGKACPFHRTVHLDPSERFQVTSDDLPVDEIHHKKWFVLPPAAEWYYSKWNISYRPLPPPMSSPEGEKSKTMDLIFPGENSEFYIPVDIDGRPQMAVFELLHREQESTVYWHLDRKYLGKTEGIHQLETRPEKGSHTLTVIDNKGAVITRNFNVLSD